MSYMHGQSLMQDGDEVLRSSRFRDRGSRGSQIYSNLRAQGAAAAAPGLNPSVIASPWLLPPSNFMERNLEFETYSDFETRKLPNGTFSEDFLGKRCWRSSRGPQHFTPMAKKIRWDSSPMALDYVSGVHREPALVQRSTLSPYTDQASIRESYEGNYGLQTSLDHPTRNDRFQGLSTHFEYPHKSSGWPCRWDYGMNQERGAPSISFRHRFHQEPIMAQKFSRSAYDLDHFQVVAEQRGLVQEIRQERYKKHNRGGRGGAPFRYRKGKRHKHVWVQNSSHREQTNVDSSISYRGKQQSLVQNSNSSLSTREEEQAVVQESGPQCSNVHKKQIPCEQSAQYKPTISSTTHDDECKAVKKSKTMMITKEALVQKSGSLTDKKPHQRNCVVEKRSATTQVECVAALDSGPVVHKEENNTGHETGTQSCPDGMNQRVVATKKKSLVQEHVAGKERSMQRCNQDVTSQRPDTRNRDGSDASSPEAKISNGSLIHDQMLVSAEKRSAGKEPAVNQEVDPLVHSQPPPVRKSNTLDCDQEHFTTTKPSGLPVRKKRKRKPRNKSLLQEHAVGKEGSTQRCNQDDTSQTPDTQNKDGFVALSPNAKRSNGSLIHDQTHVSVQMLGAGKELAANQEAYPSVHVQPPLVHKSNTLAYDQEHFTAKIPRGVLVREKRKRKPRKKLAMQKLSTSAAAHHDPPNAKVGKAIQDCIQLYEQNVSAPHECSPLKVPIDPATPSCLDPATPSCLEHGVIDQNSGIPPREEQILVQNFETEANEDLGQDIVCRACGDVGYSELLVYCPSCKISAQHCYCMNELMSMDKEDLTWVCEDCAGSFPELDSLNNHQYGLGKESTAT